MRVVRHLEPGRRPFRSPVVALGNFDGLHLGHQAIMRRTIELAERLDGEPVAFTFWPHPIAVLAPHRKPEMITSLATRIEALRDTGLAGAVVRHFTRKFAALTPDEFVREVLIERLGVVGVVVGYNVTFGRDRTGTPDVLRDLAGGYGFAVDIVPPVAIGEHTVSSSAIRRALHAGDVAHARRLLGRPHTLVGLVRHGDHRGATIGFPTANVFPRGGMLPPDGVYAVRVGIGDEPPTRPGVANLGTNPTFGAACRRLETHLFDYDGNLYGRRLRVALEHRMRGEVKFPSMQDLVAQIRKDAAAARDILGVRS